MLPLNYFPKPYTARNGYAGFEWPLFFDFLLPFGHTQPVSCFSPNGRHHIRQPEPPEKSAQLRQLGTVAAG